jgi:hypothetical protein
LHRYGAASAEAYSLDDRSLDAEFGKHASKGRIKSIVDHDAGDSGNESAGRSSPTPDHVPHQEADCCVREDASRFIWLIDTSTHW